MKESLLPRYASCIATEVLASIITGASALAGSGVDAASSAGRTKKQRKHQEKMYERQKEFWREQNTAAQNWQRQLLDYMSPKEEARRYRDAGFHPGLAMSSSGRASGSVGSTPSAAPSPASSPASGPSTNLGSVLPEASAAYVSARVGESQANLNNANADAVSGYQKMESESKVRMNNALAGLHESETVLNDLRKEGISLQNDLLSVDLAFARQDWSVASGLVSFQSPSGEFVSLPAGTLRFYMDYVATLGSLLDYDVASQTKSAQIQSIEDSAHLLHLGIPEANLNAMRNTVLQTLYGNLDSQDFVGSDGKKYSLREILTQTYGLEMLSYLDQFRNYLDRKSTMNSFDKGMAITNSIFEGVSTGVNVWSQMKSKGVQNSGTATYERYTRFDSKGRETGSTVRERRTDPTYTKYY